MDNKSAQLSARIGRTSQFWRDPAGVSAVEFALIAPFMIILYLGLADLTNAYAVKRKLTNVSSTIADLATRDLTRTGNTEPVPLAPLRGAATQLIAPFQLQNLSVVVSSINILGSGPTVSSSCSLTGGLTADPAGTAATIPFASGALTTNTGLVRARATYTYRPIWANAWSPFQAPIVLEENHYNAPRGIAPVVFPAGCP